MVYRNIEVTGTNLEEIRRSTADDRVLSKLGENIQNDWPSRRDQVDDELKQYWSYRDELSITNGIIFKSDRVFIPKKLCQRCRNNFTLPAWNRKFRAVDTMFWAGVNRELEDMIKLCKVCIKN